MARWALLADLAVDCLWASRRASRRRSRDDVAACISVKPIWPMPIGAQAGGRHLNIRSVKVIFACDADEGELCVPSCVGECCAHAVRGGGLGHWADRPV